MQKYTCKNNELPRSKLTGITPIKKYRLLFEQASRASAVENFFRWKTLRDMKLLDCAIAPLEEYRRSNDGFRLRMNSH